MNTKKTKKSTSPNSNQAQTTQGFTWNWSIMISEKVLLALITVVSSFSTGYAIGHSHQAVSQPQELPSKSVIVLPPSAVNTPPTPELSTKQH
jgi:hypothetical protein